jgi:hypothetical protein
MMCNYCQRTVRLHKSGRTFCCAYCIRVREHPHFDYLYVRDHHAYCDFCGCWMEIEDNITSEKSVPPAVAGGSVARKPPARYRRRY